MKALCWHGKNDIRYDTVPDPEIEDSRDAIIKMTIVRDMWLGPASVQWLRPRDDERRHHGS